MELRELEAFATSARLRSFSRAAEELSLTQPAITRQIGALERSVKAKLFDRLARHVELTSAGLTLLPYAQEILRAASEAALAVGEVASGTSGQLSIAASSTAATYLLPPLLKKFVEHYPGVKLSVFTGSSARVADMVESNSVDIGIVMDNQQRASITRVEFAHYATPLVVYASHPLALVHSKPLSLSELDGVPLIVMHRGTTLRAYVDGIFSAAGMKLAISMELDNVEAIKQMVAAGLGIAILPDVGVSTPSSSTPLVALSIEDVAQTQSIAAIHRSDKFVTTSMRAMIEILASGLSPATHQNP